VDIILLILSYLHRGCGTTYLYRLVYRLGHRWLEASQRLFFRDRHFLPCPARGWYPDWIPDIWVTPPTPPPGEEQ